MCPSNPGICGARYQNIKHKLEALHMCVQSRAVEFAPKALNRIQKHYTCTCSPDLWSLYPKHQNIFSTSRHGVQTGWLWYSIHSTAPTHTESKMASSHSQHCIHTHSPKWLRHNTHHTLHVHAQGPKWLSHIYITVHMSTQSPKWLGHVYSTVHTHREFKMSLAQHPL